MTRLFAGLATLLTGGVLAFACSLNPQPLPPGDGPDASFPAAGGSSSGGGGTNTANNGDGGSADSSAGGDAAVLGPADDGAPGADGATPSGDASGDAPGDGPTDGPTDQDAEPVGD